MRSRALSLSVIITASLIIITPASLQAQSSQPPLPSFNAAMVDTICGDVNYDGAIDISDAVFIMNSVFRCGPLPQPVCLGDVNADGGCNIGDTVYLLNYIFKSGPAPEPCCTEAVDRTIMQRSDKCGG
jgi:hypothetical protein